MSEQRGDSMLKLERMRTAFDRAFRNEQNENLKKIEEANNTLESKMDSLISGKIDDAALQTDIEQKLNDLETQYTPKLTEVSEELERKVSYPIQEWEYENSITIVENVTFPYGDVRRYGCLCNGIDDDSVRLQKVFDVCGLNAKPIIKPALPMLLLNPITLRSRTTHFYIFSGDDFKTDSNVITCNAEYAFVGEKFYESVPMFTDVFLNMEKIVFRCTLAEDVVIFKAINLYGSIIDKNKFYNPYILIEGSLRAWTRFDGNRIQGYRRTFIASSSTLPGITRDEVSSAYVASNYNNSILSNYLVKGEGSGVNAYIAKSNDGYVRDNYISGAQTNTALASLLEIDDIDPDLMFFENWIEFGEYITKPYLRTNTAATSTPIYGTNFANNVIQVFYRVFEENTMYSSWIFDNNDMTSFSRVRLQGVFTNAINPKFNYKKCGMFVCDRVDSDTGVLSNIVLTDNRWFTSDYGIYLDTGTASRFHRIKERGTKLLPGAGGVAEPIYVRVRVQPENQTAFLDSSYELLNNKNYQTLPILSDVKNYYLNVFNGQMLMVNGVPYLTMLGSDGLPKYQALA